MFYIFLAVFFGTLAFAFFEPFYFIGNLMSIALFGLFQAIFMANAGGAWDNSKKQVKEQGHKVWGEAYDAVHKATVTGDTVGDPFKDTSGPSLNILIKLISVMSLLLVTMSKQ